MTRKPRIVVAGQLPPPMGGQNAMIAHLLGLLEKRSDVDVEHLAFRFTPDTRTARKGKFNKVVELVRVLARLMKIRLAGPIDLMVFPPGGPQSVPMVRDVLLMPWILAVSRRVILHFHAAGIADRLAQGDRLAGLAAWLYGRCGRAIVMTEFNRRDPLACGIAETEVIAHRLTDDYQPQTADNSKDEIRILAMGHLCADKGTPGLIAAFTEVRRSRPNLVLELAGEPLAPYSAESLEADLKKAGVRQAVRLLGVIGGAEKRAAFARADLFIFPSVAPYESFGLVLVEAMMWNLPILASDWRGNGDVVGTAGGRLFSPPNSVVALTKALGEMLNDRERWPEYGAFNRERFLYRFSRNDKEEPLVDHLIRTVQQPDSP